MPITLVTGTPGAGKTLFTVKKIIEELAPSGRPIYTNINGLSVDASNVHICDETTPHTWHDGSIEDGAVFVFDEVQRQYPPRNSQSKVPDYIAQYETHRHRGFDFFFVTQGPRLLDRHLHDLIDRHFHLYRPFGLSSSTVLEWNGVNLSPAPAQTRANASVKRFNFPSKYFDAYKSSTAHTIKRRIPWKFVLVVVGVIALICFVAYRAYFFFTDSSMVTGRIPTPQEASSSPLAPLSAAQGVDLSPDPAPCFYPVAHTAFSSFYSDGRTTVRVPLDQMTNLGEVLSLCV